jgi:hypothetical protein
MFILLILTLACLLDIVSSTTLSISSIEFVTLFWMRASIFLPSEELACMMGTDNFPLLFRILI